MSESVIQRKVAKLVKAELSHILSFELKYVAGAMITISAVRMTGDLGIAKVYLTVLPAAKLPQVLEALSENNWEVRRALAARIRNKVRKIPELRFFEDDSFEYASRIDDLLNDD
jgi:ribosome-binding factor A